MQQALLLAIEDEEEVANILKKFIKLYVLHIKIACSVPGVFFHPLASDAFLY